MKGKGAGSKLNNPRLSLPSELIGEIMSNLPLKSLLRFSAVSKSWNSMIFYDPVFARKHKNRAAMLPRSQRVVLCMHEFGEAPVALLSLAPISSDLRMKVIKEEEEEDDEYSGDESSDNESDPSFSVFSNAKDKDDVIRDFIGQFEGKPYLLAYCDELLCVQVKQSLFLWNPSMGNVAEVPPPLSSLMHSDYFLYGLAYDSVNDDYKILRLERDSPYRTELYSQKHDCWREIKPFSSDVGPSHKQRRCEFVGGRFHWVGLATATAGAPIIASFDLSTDEYGEVALPPEYDDDEDELEVVTLNGKLCAYVNYVDYGEDETQFILWSMEDNGVENSWTERFDIMLSQPSILPGCSHPESLRPLFLSDNNDLVVTIRGCCSNDNIYILMYRNGEAIRPNIIVKCERYCDVDAFLYVESLITHNNFSKSRSR